MTTPGQDAQACPTCRADPSTALGRYCASAFTAHRRVGQCLDPRTVGLVGRPSRTAPGEVVWAFPASDVPWGGVADAP